MTTPTLWFISNLRHARSVLGPRPSGACLEHYPAGGPARSSWMAGQPQPPVDTRQAFTASACCQSSRSSPSLHPCGGGLVVALLAAWSHLI
jgi:hypothetical protein